MKPMRHILINIFDRVKDLPIQLKHSDSSSLSHILLHLYVIPLDETDFIYTPSYYDIVKIHRIPTHASTNSNTAATLSLVFTQYP